MIDKPWLRNYPINVPFQLCINESNSLISLFDTAFASFANLPMIENMGKVLKYKDVDQLSKNFCSYIQNFTKLKPGDRVAIQLPNILQYPVAVIGLLRAGIVVVNINPLYTSYELEKHLIDARVSAIILLENFADKFESISEKVNLDLVIVAKVGDLLGPIKGAIVNFVSKSVKKIVPKFCIPNAVSFKNVLKVGKTQTYKNVNIEGHQTAFIQYTGGTTGILKGAVLSHNNLATNIEQMRAWIGSKLEEGKETMVTAIPFYHIFSLTVNLFTMMKLGAKNILVTNPRNLKSLMNDMIKSKLTCMAGVGALYNLIMSDKKFRKIDFSRLKIAMSGGMSLSDRVANAWKSMTGTSIVEAYGLTEASPAVIGNPFDGTHKQGFIGLPIPNTEAAIVDDEMNKLPFNTPGNLIIKGPQVMQGYWENPFETANVLKDGWLLTGDIAIMEESGFIKIVDRKKDVINVSGFSVFPSEIENILAMHSAVSECAVVGMPYNEFKEEIVAYVVLKNDCSAAEKEILEHCKKYLTNYKQPKKIKFIDSLPKSNVGKILKYKLKECAI